MPACDLALCSGETGLAQRPTYPNPGLTESREGECRLCGPARVKGTVCFANRSKTRALDPAGPAAAMGVYSVRGKMGFFPNRRARAALPRRFWDLGWQAGR
jgi:hypothetical protein